MIERYILVSDDEYCYTLDTQDENYKTLEDFEKEEFENAKKEGIDINEYEDAILEKASDDYWDWVYNNHLEADAVNNLLNAYYGENQTLKEEIKKLDTFKKILDYAEKDMAERADWQAYCEKEFEGL